MTKGNLIDKYQFKIKQISDIFNKAEEIKAFHVCRILHALRDEYQLILNDLEELNIN